MDKNLYEQTFFQARLKVDRANRHIDEAQQWFRAYTEGDFHQISDDRNLETGQQIIRVTVAPVPAHMVLAIGDAFHCLSSALEYVMSGLMNAKTGDTNRIHFPADETRAQLRKTLMKPRKPPRGEDPPRRRIVKAFPAVVCELLTVIKPYKGGNFALWEIRQADNLDKHNLIIPSVTVTELRGFRAVDKVNNGTFAPEAVFVGAGGIIPMISYINSGHSLEIEDKGQASASIAFSQTMEVFGGKPVFPTLLECSQFVSEAIDRIEIIARRYL